MPAIAELTLPALNRSGRISRVGRPGGDRLAQHLQQGVHPGNEALVLIGPIGANETDMGREDRSPGGQLAALAKVKAGPARQGSVDAIGQQAPGGGQVGDRGRHPCRRSHHVGTEHRQIKARVRKEHAVQDLQAGSQTGGFEVQLAQTPCRCQLVADEQGLPIKAAADLFEISGQGQGGQFAEILPAAADAIGQRNHQRMKTHRRGAQQNADPAMGLPLSTIARPPLLDGLESVHSRTLRSGARVVSLNLPEAPLICLDLWCRAGSAFETAAESGMAHFLEHMVFKGSDQQQAGDFDLQVEALGGHSNAATGFDDVHYHVLVPPAAATQACELLLDLVLRPRLDQQDLELERQVVLEELAQSQDQPDEMALQTLLQLGCSDHPYGRAILGERDLLESHTSGSMRRFQQRLYGAQHCVLAMSGPLEQPRLEALFEQLEQSPLASLPRTATTPVPPPLQLHPGEHRRTFARLEAARLLMAWSLPGAAERQAVAALDLATSLLAEGRRSRLVARLREELRLVESIDLDLQVLECGSLGLLEAVCDPDDLPVVRRQIEGVLREIQETPPPAVEIERGRKLVANGYRFGLEAAAGVAGVIGNGALWQRPSDLNDPLRALRAVDAEQLQQSFALLDPSRACVLEAVPA